jgi:hypothetical protein
MVPSLIVQVALGADATALPSRLKPHGAPRVRSLPRFEY